MGAEGRKRNNRGIMGGDGSGVGEIRAMSDDTYVGRLHVETHYFVC